jgi:hypothetical protein
MLWGWAQDQEEERMNEDNTQNYRHGRRAGESAAFCFRCVGGIRLHAPVSRQQRREKLAIEIDRETRGARARLAQKLRDRGVGRQPAVPSPLKVSTSRNYTSLQFLHSDVPSHFAQPQMAILPSECQRRIWSQDPGALGS